MTIEDLSFLIEGFYAYRPDQEAKKEELEFLLSRLVEYHESTPQELQAALEFYRDGKGERPELPFFDETFRDEFLQQSV